MGLGLWSEQIRIRVEELQRSWFWYIVYISVMKTAPARSSLADAERKLRSRIAQLVHGRWLLHGAVAPRQRVCGKPNCRCAQGQLHASLYLVRSRRGKVQQLFVPRSWEQRVRQAVADYQQLERLLEEVSEREWKRLQDRREE